MKDLNRSRDKKRILKEHSKAGKKDGKSKKLNLHPQLLKDLL